MKKKKTNFDKVVDRIYRRTNTLKKHGVALRTKATKGNIKEILTRTLKGGGVTKRDFNKLGKADINEFVDDQVKQFQRINPDQIKMAQEQYQDIYGKRISRKDIQSIDGMQMHEMISNAIENDINADDARAMFGY